MTNQNGNIHETAVVDDQVQIGDGTDIWHFSHVMPGAKIGKNCTLGQNVFVGENVTIGNNVKIQNNVSLYTGVSLEDDVFCGPSVVFTNVKNPRSNFPKDTSEYSETIVRSGATLGANATVICGHELGRYCFIGGGAVIINDIMDFEFAAGTPAEQKGYACVCGEVLSTNDILETWTCDACNRSYIHNESGVILDE